MPDCVSFVRYQTNYGIVSFFQSGAGLTGCRTVWHTGIALYIYIHGHAVLTWTCTCSMDMDMQHGHGHAAQILTCNMDLDNGYALEPECRNADKKLSLALLVFG
jgi:hypothetical protein